MSKLFVLLFVAVCVLCYIDEGVTEYKGTITPHPDEWIHYAVERGAMNADKEVVELRVMKRQDRSHYMEIRVRSQVRPGLKKLGIIELGRDDLAKTKQRVAVCAAAMAEELCEAYSDTLDPSAVAGVTIEAFDELMAENPTINWGDEPRRVSGPMALN